MKVICFHRWNILKYDEGSTDVQKERRLQGGRGREKYEERREKDRRKERGLGRKEGRRTEGKRRGWVGKKGEGPKEREGVG